MRPDLDLEHGLRRRERAAGSQADRDDAIETAAKAFLSGGDPWQARTMLGSRTYSGPASVLVAAPFVAVFGRINEISFVFWVGFLAALLIGDLRSRNGSLLLLGLLWYVGNFELYYAQHWSLDELFYPQLWIVLAWASWSRGRPRLSGVALAAAVLSRVNYVFLAWAFVCWAIQETNRRNRVWRLFQGSLLGSALFLLPVAGVCGFGALRDFAEISLGVGERPSSAGSLAAVVTGAATAALGASSGLRFSPRSFSC